MAGGLGLDVPSARAAARGRGEHDTFSVGQGRVGTREFVLRAGDALHFEASSPHAWKNEGAVGARFLVIGTLPKALRAALHERLGAAAEDGVRGRAAEGDA